MVWIPEWAWFLAMLPGALVLVLMALRSGVGKRSLVWFLLGVTPTVIVGAGIWQREWHPVRTVGEGDKVRIVFLNANHPSKERADDVVDVIQAREPDLVIVVNPGWLVPAWRSRNATPPDGKDGWMIRHLHSLMVASRHGPVAIRSMSLVDGIMTLRIDASDEVAEILGLSDIIVVDLPSDPMRDRADILERVSGILRKQREEQGVRADLLLGDFNTTPRTVGVEDVWPGLVDLFSTSGSGWGATWPRERPLIRIDLVLAGEDVEAERLSTFDPGWGGHRGLLIEIAR